jgi:hypothetical protein
MSKTSHDGEKLNLVFSDEFNKDGRTFYEGDDPYFQAMDIWYGVTQDRTSVTQVSQQTKVLQMD